MKKKKRTKSKSAPKVKRTKKPSPIIAIPLILISLFVLTATIYKIIEIVSTSNPATSFPKLEISLKDVPIEQIDANSKDIKYPNNSVTLITNEKSTTFDDVEIKGRGNSTWANVKKPYQIKFNDEVNLFGYGEARKWVLLANSLDSAHLRNDAAFYLENALQEDYALNGQFVELYIDNQYRGLYYLSEKVEIGPARVNLHDDSGIIVELENLHSQPNECIYTKNNNCMVIHDAVNHNDPSSDINKFIDAFNQLESTIDKKDYAEITQLIDIDSFAKYYLLNEFTVNPDAYSSSFYLYKDGENDKIHAGPGWDFDLALGSSAWASEGVDYSQFLSPFVDTALKEYTTFSNQNALIPFANSISTMFYQLMDIPEFEAKVKEIYQETLSGHKEELLNHIKSQADYIRPAAYRDQERWKIKTDFNEEIDYLIDWVNKRYEHFEEVYGKNSTPKEAPESPQPESE